MIITPATRAYLNTLLSKAIANANAGKPFEAFDNANLLISQIKLAFDMR